MVETLKGHLYKSGGKKNKTKRKTKLKVKKSFQRKKG